MATLDPLVCHKTARTLFNRVDFAIIDIVRPYY